MEIWKQIPGYPLHEVSTEGRVRSCARGKITVINPWISRLGYFIFKPRKSEPAQYIHRLMAITFLPNPHGWKVVKHKNGIKTDNRMSNIEWVVPRDIKRCKYKNRKAIAELTVCEQKPVYDNKSEIHIRKWLHFYRVLGGFSKFPRPISHEVMAKVPGTV